MLNSICCIYCAAPSIDHQYKYSVVLILFTSRRIRLRDAIASTDQERMRRTKATAASRRLTPCNDRPPMLENMVYLAPSSKLHLTLNFSSFISSLTRWDI